METTMTHASAAATARPDIYSRVTNRIIAALEVNRPRAME
jgi:antirestriction protein ArdC